MKPLFIFLGNFYCPQILKTVKDDTMGKVGFSNHNFELKLVDGLLDNQINLEVVTAPKVFSYPFHNKRPHIDRYVWNIKNGVKAVSVGFNNIFGVNKITIPYSVYKQLNDIISKHKEQYIYIIIDTPTIALLQAVREIKKIGGDKIKSCLIVPDIPKFVTSLKKRNFISQILVDYLNRKSISLCKTVDSFVLLTDQMKNLLPIGQKPYIVMEGICSNSPTLKITKVHNKAILYTGTLAKMYGICNLLDAFSLIDDSSAELWICGSGNAQDDIIKRANKDSRIKFYGLVDTEQACQLQQNAAVLVNPRTNEGEYTKYSFPSKTIEYMMAGKPVVMYKLEGIPNEYDKFLFYAEDNTVQSLKNALMKVLALDQNERESIGLMGKEFVMRNKTAKIQTNRIIELCHKLHNNENIGNNSNI